ncbi:MAG TPA: M20/M25/M40 family metallo-hydrolase [Solirubrobacterales bacterium]|nr:M20/M25/M40 family metallo-hydrolase [Solirubrobacterales bacterium]HEU4979737.1 M20/M25/M40 family metallo-hydrolase [Solirubrobacterales bacterium]
MEEGTSTTAVPAALGTAATALLQSLIRVDTVNPPGNERRIQEELRKVLTEAGFECELLGAEPDRPNLVARLHGEREGPTLTLLGHVDTVRADPGEWTHDPWGGAQIDGWIWGRGALDMKGQVAAEVAACLELARSGWRPAGELMLVLTADEETGGTLGAHWLCQQHPDRVRTDFVVNEGGGALIEIGDRRLYTMSVGEKGIFRIRLRTEGRAGHASLPRIGDNALLRLSSYLAALAEQPPPEPGAVGEALLENLFGDSFEGAEGVRAGLERLRAEQPLLADYLIEPMLGVTLSPTKAESGKKANVIPSEAEALIDCRVPPGYGQEEARRQLAALIGEGDYTIEFTEAVVGNTSPVDSPLADAIRAWAADADPGAEIVPTIMPSFSDSNPFRTAFPDAIVYGFCPHREITQIEQAPLVHGADERVPVADIEFAAAFFHDLPRRILS